MGKFDDAREDGRRVQLDAKGNPLRPASEQAAEARKRWRGWRPRDEREGGMQSLFEVAMGSDALPDEFKADLVRRREERDKDE